MEAIFGDDRLDLRQFGNLMDERGRVLASQGLAATATSRGFARNSRGDLFGRDERPLGFAMAGLTAAFSLAARSRRFPLRADRIGRGQLGRVGGVQFESRFQVADFRCEFPDLRLQLDNSLLHNSQRGGDRRLSVGR